MNNILDMLENAAFKYGNKIAFADKENSISYISLWDKAKKIAMVLKDKVELGQPVAILMDKSVDAICVLFGVVCSGAAYSFVERQQPSTRIQNILNTLNPAVVIWDKEQQVSSEIEYVQIGFDKINDDIGYINLDDSFLESIRKEIIGMQPLYINFTSGSTGIPKGVSISHLSVLDFIPNFVDVMNIDNSDVIGNQAPLDFDVSVKDIYSCLCTGARVELIPKEYFMNPQLLMNFLCDRKVSILTWAVSALCFITTMRGLEYRCPSQIKCIGFSGECMPIKHLNKLREYLPNTKFINLYGPTEITCNCTYYEIPKDKQYSLDEDIPIGNSFINKKVFLLDDNNRLISPEKKDEIGEICVVGSGVALGYYGNAEKTKESFVQNPLHNLYIEKTYRTGDLAKYNSFGELVYVSRKDSQIKHMGHRIELGEIETAFTGIDGVDRAVCIYIHEKKKIIVFYCGERIKEEVADNAKKLLPMFMIPNKIIQLKQMPLNEHGKIDRTLLKEMA